MYRIFIVVAAVGSGFLLYPRGVSGILIHILKIAMDSAGRIP